MAYLFAPGAGGVRIGVGGSTYLFAGGAGAVVAKSSLSTLVVDELAPTEAQQTVALDVDEIAPTEAEAIVVPAAKGYKFAPGGGSICMNGSTYAFAPGAGALAVIGSLPTLYIDELVPTEALATSATRVRSLLFINT